jgi:mitochondrial fission protein ELM1
VYQYRESFEIKGGMTYWDTVLVPVHDRDGQIVRLIGSSRDLTQQLAVEEALRQSRKTEATGQALSMAIGKASHSRGRNKFQKVRKVLFDMNSCAVGS